MKNILMIAYTEYNHDARVRREAQTLAQEKGFKVRILVLKAAERAKTQDSEGIRIIEVNQKKYTGSSKLNYICAYIQFLLRCFAKCTCLFIRGQADIVHVHNMPNCLVGAALLPRLFGRKLILDIHDSIPETYLSKFSNKNSLLFRLLCFEEKVSAAIAHRIICVNQIQKEVLVGRRIDEGKIVISMNVPDPSLFPVNGRPAAEESKNGIFRMVYHGTIADRLGVDLAVSAVAMLSATIPGLEFHVLSKAGPALDKIENLGNSLNVGKRMHLLRGGVPVERLAGKLRYMNLGIVSNRKGAATDLMLPVKMLECIALGIPVVAPRLKCIQYYFSEDMVSFFEPENVESMASAILSLYKDPDRRSRQAKRAQLFLDRYGWENHKYDLIRMYETL